MRRLFCYTLSARAIGATVSAGALHAQGWGFESLIAHHLIDKAPSNGSLSFLGPSQRDSNPKDPLVQGPWSKKGKNEYCYLFDNSIFEVSEGEFDIKAADNGSG